MSGRLSVYTEARKAIPGIKITRIVDIGADPPLAFDTATQIIGNEKKEKIDAFVCVEALSGKEIATVLNNNGVKGKVVMAMDTDQDTLEWIQKGVITVEIGRASCRERV